MPRRDLLRRHRLVRALAQAATAVAEHRAFCHVATVSIQWGEEWIKVDPGDGRGWIMTIGGSAFTGDSSWAARGACVTMDPDGFFVQGAEQHAVKAACGACPVRTECLADALDNRVDFGVWGGMTERERRRLLRRHPHVSDWSALLRRAEQQAVGG